jgi:hypothetical protein
MEQKIPFTSYDTWAYLSAGFLLLFAIDYVAATHLLARDSWTVVQAVMALVSAYVVGHPPQRSSRRNPSSGSSPQRA